MTALIIVLVIVLVIAGGGVLAFNGLVRRRTRTQEAWSEIDVELKRRHDLIPNLVETVKGYAQHEEGVYKDIADARAQMMAAKSPEETIQAANRQTTALGRLFAIAENYPNLKANEQFNRLMDELSGTENRLAVERMRYNERVQEYDAARRQFPANITARMFGFKEYPYFQAPPEAKQVPKVNFGKTS